MPSRFRNFPVTFLYALLALASIVLTLSPQPGQAQGLFDSLLNALSGRGWLPPEEDHGEGPYQAYCVRLCDGRFFPLPAANGQERERERERPRTTFFFRDYRSAREERRPAAVTTGDASPDSLCKAMCPATSVKVFSGTQIDNAVSGEGIPYSKLQNAFVYREKIIPECSCNGIENAGIANLDAESDPTLQPGDIIVTPEGPKVYRGRSGQPSATSFVPVKDYRGLPESMRRNLSEMRITRMPEPVTAPASSAATSRPASVVQPTLNEDSTMRSLMP